MKEIISIKTGRIQKDSQQTEEVNCKKGQLNQAETLNKNHLQKIDIQNCQKDLKNKR